MNVELFAYRTPGSSWIFGPYRTEGTARNAASQDDTHGRYAKNTDCWQWNERKYEIVKLTPVFRREGDGFVLDLEWVNV